ncbi:SLOG family protein [Candidatus Soleaferrea massiliensis]|uniref:SLOG family protein n=1 Tax=Candidatus Soleaferrea massiliensis TaxID=1470354 RepID=UPI000591688B|nr:SLOG family protein [Candidatus Soleaferrea massiliensis]
MKEQTCCFTGHRDISEGDTAGIVRLLEYEVEKLICEGVCYFGAGGAQGFDTIAAQVVLKMRERHPQIRLILVLPCRDQTQRWNQKDKQIYDAILSRADKVVYLADQYYRGCMHQRNRYLVDHSGHCICYLRRDMGGTAYTVRYAKSKGVHVINLFLIEESGVN